MVRRARITLPEIPRAQERSQTKPNIRPAKLTSINEQEVQVEETTICLRKTFEREISGVFEDGVLMEETPSMPSPPPVPNQKSTNGKSTPPPIPGKTPPPIPSQKNADDFENIPYGVEWNDFEKE